MSCPQFSSAAVIFTGPPGLTGFSFSSIFDFSLKRCAKGSFALKESWEICAEAAAPSARRAAAVKRTFKTARRNLLRHVHDRNRLRGGEVACRLPADLLDLDAGSGLDETNAGAAGQHVEDAEVGDDAVHAPAARERQRA